MTKRLEKRREALQKDYANGDILEMEFLKTIGALTDKSKTKTFMKDRPGVENQNLLVSDADEHSLR